MGDLSTRDDDFFLSVILSLGLTRGLLLGSGVGIFCPRVFCAGKVVLEYLNLSMCVFFSRNVLLPGQPPLLYLEDNAKYEFK